jgi:hypothetical protein
MSRGTLRKLNARDLPEINGKVKNFMKLLFSKKKNCEFLDLASNHQLTRNSSTLLQSLVYWLNNNISD